MKKQSITLLKGLIVGHLEDDYDNRALMPSGDKFTLVDNLIIGATILDLYRFVDQPEYCQHSYCGFNPSRKNAKGHSIKPKCMYASYRRLTTAELSKPDMNSLFLAMNVSYLVDMDDLCGLAVFDLTNEKFDDHWFQDGGNDRLVPHGSKVQSILTSKSNYVDFVKAIKAQSIV